MSTDAFPQVDGFEISRRISPGRWAAVETSLLRDVALLELRNDSFGAADWPDEAGAPRLFGLVEGSGGRYLITQWRPDFRTLAERSAQGASARQQNRWLDEASHILARQPHGRLAADDILIDDAGVVWVTGFSVAGEPQLSDQVAIATLRPSAKPASRLGWVATVAVIALAALAAAVWTARLTPRSSAVPAAGGTVYGSVLEPGGIRSLNCRLEEDNRNSPTCTLMQRSLPGHRLTTQPGVVRQWTVRGVQGRVRLQVIRAVAPGRWTVIAESDPITVEDPAEVRTSRVSSLIVAAKPTWPNQKRANPVLPPDARFGLRLSPGTSVGVRDSVPGASLAQFLGPVPFLESTRPTARRGASEELMLRVDVEPRP